MDTIPCISLWQPWASLIAIGAKQIETRHWATRYRGPLAIHAAKRTTELREISGNTAIWKAFEGAGMLHYPAKVDDNWSDDDIGAEFYFSSAREKLRWCPLPLGAIIAVVELTDCVPTWKGGGLGECWLRDSLSEQERSFGDYSAGRFGWRLQNVRSLSEPVPYKGEQGLFRVPSDLLGESR